MTGRGSTQRTPRRSAAKEKSESEDYDDPLGIEANIAVKHEVCPDLPAEEDEVFGMVDGQQLIEEQQRIQRVYHMDMAPHDQQNISDRLSSLERKVDFLLNVNTKILARVDKICENMKAPTPPNDFPIKDKEELEEIDVKISNSPDKYIELFKNLLNPSGIVKNIGRIFDQSMLMEMNYGGLSSKTGLSNYIHLNTALFESQKKEGYTFDDYKKNVRLAFQKAKNRVYKAVSEQRRLKKLKIGANDSKTDDNDIKSNEIE